MSQRVDLGGAATGPLNGVRVIDFTAVYSGPIAASILGDQGAEVIKIESKSGDLMRRAQPMINGMGSSFATMNRNKKSLCLDLQTDAGRDIARRLIATADVVMENFRPGVMDRLGLGYAEFKDAQPKLVYASINGVGPTGPYAKRRVYDAVIQAISGFTTLQPEGDPAMVNSLVCDKITSLTAAEAVVAALFQAERSGRGQRVELSMLDANLFFLWPDVMTNYTFLQEGIEAVPRLDHSMFLRKTKDGWIAMGQVPGGWDAFADMLGIEELKDPKYANPTTRGEYRDELEAIVEPWVREHTKLEIYHASQARRNAIGYVATPEDMFSSPQLEARNFFQEIDHPVAGRARYPGLPFRLYETEATIARAPLLGEHNTEVYGKRLGLEPQEIVRLSQLGII